MEAFLFLLDICAMFVVVRWMTKSESVGSKAPTTDDRKAPAPDGTR